MWEQYLAIVSIILVPIGAVVWLVRLEGRVTGHDSLFMERKDQEKDRYETLLREIGSLRELVITAMQSRSARQVDQNPSQTPSRLS